MLRVDEARTVLKLTILQHHIIGRDVFANGAMEVVICIVVDKGHLVTEVVTRRILHIQC